MSLPITDAQAITVACPECRAAAGAPCVWAGWVCQHLPPHAARLARAQSIMDAAMTEVGDAL